MCLLILLSSSSPILCLHVPASVALCRAWSHYKVYIFPFVMRCFFFCQLITCIFPFVFVVIFVQETVGSLRNHAKYQRRMFDQAVKLVRPGGVIVYSTFVSKIQYSLFGCQCSLQLEIILNKIPTHYNEASCVHTSIVFSIARWYLWYDREIQIEKYYNKMMYNIFTLDTLLLPSLLWAVWKF